MPEWSGCCWPSSVVFMSVQLCARVATRCPSRGLWQASRNISSAAASSPRKSPRLRKSNCLIFGALALLSLPSAYFLYNAASHNSQSIACSRFTPCTISNIQQLTPQTSIFTLDLPRAGFQPPGPPKHALTSLYVAQPEIQIQRPFTPLHPLQRDTRQVQLLVKRYDSAGAEMSQYIHRQRVGDQLLVRGPELTWSIEPNTKHITFVR